MITKTCLLQTWDSARVLEGQARRKREDQWLGMVQTSAKIYFWLSLYVCTIWVWRYSLERHQLLWSSSNSREMYCKYDKSLDSIPFCATYKMNLRSLSCSTISVLYSGDHARISRPWVSALYFDSSLPSALENITNNGSNLFVRIISCNFYGR